MRVDGISARDGRNDWVGREGHVLLLDGRGRRFDTGIGVGNGEFKGDLPPGRYIAVAGTNDQLTWTWVDPQWNDARLLAEMVKLGTRFTIEPGKTTALTLPDRTVAIQNATAKLGCTMYRR